MWWSSFKSDAPTSQQWCPSHPPRRNGDRVWGGDPQGMVDIIPTDLVDMVVPMAPKVVVMLFPLMNLFRCHSDGSCSSELGRWCKHDWHSKQHGQFEQSTIAMNISLVQFVVYIRSVADQVMCMRKGKLWCMGSDWQLLVLSVDRFLSPLRESKWIFFMLKKRRN